MLITSILRRSIAPVRSGLVVRNSGEVCVQRNGADLLELHDVARAELVRVSEQLGKKYMEKNKEVPTFPVEGLIHGLGRKYVLMTVKRVRGEEAIWVPFVVDGGSPHNLLSRDALIALGANPDECSFLHVNVHGFDTIPVYHEAHSHLRDLNVLGWSFFQSTKCFELMDPKTKTLRIYKSIKHALGPELAASLTRHAPSDD